MEASLENLWMRRARWLTQALILSGTLNIGLMATFIYFVVRERQASLSLELRPMAKESTSKEASNEQFLRAYSVLPYQELLLRLDANEPVEGGLAKRDIALACLVAFHHFNLDKALEGVVLQKRSLLLRNIEGSETMEVIVYPGLADDHFQAISNYAKTEKWPFTSQGLFYELKRALAVGADTILPQINRDLMDAFCLSSEFSAVQTLFVKTGLPLPTEALIELVCAGEWKTLSDFYHSQRRALDLSVARRRQFLLSYLDQHAFLAAKILLSTDFDYVVKHLEDPHLLKLFEHSQDQLPELKKVASALLAAPRTDAVWKRAAEVLYASTQESTPEPYDHHEVLRRFAPQLLPRSVAPPAKPVEAPLKPHHAPVVSKKLLHKVEPGDSLWKIARRYHVTIKALMELNHLESERLKVGRQLEIPEQ